MDASAIPDSAFCLKWRLTWPDRDVLHDFVGFDGETRVCRIYRTAPPSLGERWYWCAGQTRNLGTGQADSARAAALAAERAYFAAE